MVLRCEARPRAFVRRGVVLASVVLGAWWFIGRGGGRELTRVRIRYRLGEIRATELRGEILRGAAVYHESSWLFPSGHPAEEVEEVQLPPGDYLVEAHALGSKKPDPRPIPIAVGAGGVREATVDF